MGFIGYADVVTCYLNYHRITIYLGVFLVETIFFRDNSFKIKASMFDYLFLEIKSTFQRQILLGWPRLTSTRVDVGNLAQCTNWRTLFCNLFTTSSKITSPHLNYWPRSEYNNLKGGCDCGFGEVKNRVRQFVHCAKLATSTLRFIICEKYYMYFVKLYTKYFLLYMNDACRHRVQV
jgi:hypothetical protein